MDEPTKLISLAEAAEIAGCDTSTLRRAAMNKTLNAQKIGKSWIVMRRDLFDWLANADAHKVGKRKASAG